MASEQSRKLANRLRTACADISAIELAQLAGCSEDSVRRYFSGESKPSIEFVRAVCERSGAPAEWMIRGEDFLLSSSAAIEYARRLSTRQLIQALLERMVNDADESRGRTHDNMAASNRVVAGVIQ